MVKPITTILLLLILFPLGLAAQVDCNRKLDEAKEQYKKGKLHQVLETLDECLCQQKGRRMDCKLPEDNQIEAYELLTETYIHLDSLTAARSSFLKLLHLDHGYEIDSLSLSSDLIYLYYTFRTKPVVSISAYGGPNTTRVKVLQDYSTDNNTTSDEDYSKISFGIHAGVLLDIPVNESFELSLGAQYMSRRYRYVDVLNTSLLDDATFSTLSFSEAQTWLSFPVQMRLYLPSNRIKYYIYGGFSPEILLKVELINLQRASDAGFTNAESLPLNGKNNANPLRAPGNFSLYGGIGLKWPVGLDFITINARYNYMVNNVVNTNNRYTNDRLLYEFAHVDNDIRQSDFSLSIGYSKSIYRPKQKNNPDPTTNKEFIRKTADSMGKEGAKFAKEVLEEEKEKLKKDAKAAKELLKEKAGEGMDKAKEKLMKKFKPKEE